MKHVHELPVLNTPKTHIDPVCGMKVGEESAAGNSEYRGRTYFFCALGCKRKFDADPQQFLEPRKPVAAVSHDVEYTCPMHPEIRQMGPGNCPKCGMALEPSGVAVEAENPEFAFMWRRFWISAVLTLPLLAMMTREFFVKHPMDANWVGILQFGMATPVVL